jgi:hypothetical protein
MMRSGNHTQAVERMNRHLKHSLVENGGGRRTLEVLELNLSEILYQQW